MALLRTSHHHVMHDLQGFAPFAKLWLLATKPLPKLGALAVHFGGLPPQPAELIAPNVLACVVPEGPWASASEAAPEAAVPVPLRVTGTNGAGRPFDLRCELQFTLQRCGSG